MSTVNMLQAKTQLSKLVEAVESGAEEEIIIARNGKPAARLVPLDEKKRKIRLGLAEGKYDISMWEDPGARHAENIKMLEDSIARDEEVLRLLEARDAASSDDDAASA